MIGMIYSSVIPFYDNSSHANSYKKRPVLIIGGPRNNDYTILPISTISNKSNLDPEYDVEINPEKYPLLNLRQTSYVRTHKQTYISMKTGIDTKKSISSLQLMFFCLIKKTS